MYDIRDAAVERADQLADRSVKGRRQNAGVSLVSALKDQLGLKLTVRKVTTDMIVIDSAEKASPELIKLKADAGEDGREGDCAAPGIRVGC